MLKKFFAVVFNILFPNHCIICKNIIQSDKINYICLDCINKLSYIHRDDYIRCNRCGRIIDTKDSTCICSYENIYFDECKSMLYYDDKTSNLIHKMKFSHRYLICKDFAVMLSFYYKDYINKFDVVSFVPLGKNRLLERGYNQSELIARHISKIINIPLIENIIIRKKESKSLSMIKGKELREKAIKNAFKINQKYKFNNNKKINILVIDDVFTTGSTLNEMSLELRKLEFIERIGVLTVASAR
ncbi:ComF family protein [Brachyspira pilosicoli]|uniref:ComF family protein n=1 Tax=Brachyspira pilosicoli TaxID=52584 RepID=UPI001C6682CF|nr:ComF family protein [Brachyspira pilosicoli]MBW5382411.1 ComF family protein [Brachyspira pilosicoli]WIH81044.1 ComF family protein [Brachyspira pilosicoli]WIH87754.1 ComF family protein [Brachyspira pilosicoli]